MLRQHNAQKERHLCGGGSGGVGRRDGENGKKTSIFNRFPGIKDSTPVLVLCREQSRESERGEEGTRSREQSRGPLEGKQLSCATTSARGASAAQQTETFTIYILKCIFKHLDSYCSSVRFKITILVLGFFFSKVWFIRF